MKDKQIMQVATSKKENKAIQFSVTNEKVSYFLGLEKEVKSSKLITNADYKRVTTLATAVGREMTNLNKERIAKAKEIKAVCKTNIERIKEDSKKLENAVIELFEELNTPLLNIKNSMAKKKEEWKTIRQAKEAEKARLAEEKAAIDAVIEQKIQKIRQYSEVGILNTTDTDKLNKILAYLKDSFSPTVEVFGDRVGEIGLIVEAVINHIATELENRERAILLKKKEEELKVMNRIGELSALINTATSISMIDSVISELSSLRGFYHVESLIQPVLNLAQTKKDSLILTIEEYDNKVLKDAVENVSNIVASNNAFSLASNDLTDKMADYLVNDLERNFKNVCSNTIKGKLESIIFEGRNFILTAEADKRLTTELDTLLSFDVDSVNTADRANTLVTQARSIIDRLSLRLAGKNILEQAENKLGLFQSRLDYLAQKETELALKKERQAKIEAEKQAKIKAKEKELERIKTEKKHGLLADDNASFKELLITLVMETSGHDLKTSEGGRAIEILINNINSSVYPSDLM